MLFNSYQFLIFFPIVSACYFLIPHQWRWLLLLIASCVFYMAFIPVYILILFALILIDYYAAIWIEESPKASRKKYLIISILSTCSTLFIFKYFNFFNSSIAHAAQYLHLNYPIGALQLILPIGLSFHTFQSLSYVIEVYRNKQKAERHLGIYALYVLFYPQLVAGPIERPQNLLHQFYEKHAFDYQRVTDGLKLMAWGLFKKVVIANHLAVFVGIVYDNPAQFQGLSIIIATIFFAFQIYCDFSGYSDIAIGAAQVMGFKLMDNFNRPYSSRSIAEFWKRWHISLSTWFKDYVYIPLGGNKTTPLHHYYNLFITFLISGLWHGANWTYIIWGALNGAYMIIGLLTRDLRQHITRRLKLNQVPRLYHYIQVFITFSLVCFAWIFFRAKNITDAMSLVKNSFSISFDGILSQLCLGLPKKELLLSVGLILFLIFVHSIQKHGSIRHMLRSKPAWLRWMAYYFITASIVLSLFFEGSYPKPFIYFQF